MYVERFLFKDQYHLAIETIERRVVHPESCGRFDDVAKLNGTDSILSPDSRAETRGVAINPYMYHLERSRMRGL